MALCLVGRAGKTAPTGEGVGPHPLTEREEKLLAVGTGDRMRAHDVSDCFESEKFEDAALAQAVTLTFSAEEI